MRKYGRLLGKAPLGRGQAGAVGNKPRFLGPPYYLVNDTFTTDRAAGAVNGTKAEPGPGLRRVVDTEGKLTLSGGNLVPTGGKASPAYNDPYLYYPILRVAGRMAIFSVAVNNTTTRAVVGFGQIAPSAAQCTAIFLINAEIRADSGAGFTWVNVGTLTVATHKFAVVQRAAGGFHFQWVGGNPILLWVDSAETAGDAVGIGNYNATYSYQYLRVPAARWLPTPLASDGFSSWGTTDGLGHAEGVAGGLGSGGSGLSWADVTGGGTWSAAGGVAVNAGGTGVDEIAHVNTGKADVIASAKFTRVSDSGGVVVRCDSNGANYVKAVHNGTNAQLIKVVGGTPTTLINTAATYVAGAEIRIICDGTKFRLYYNNALIGAEQTIADAGLASGTRQGLVNTNGAGNTFDDFMVRARGTGGEYSALDNY